MSGELELVSNNGIISFLDQLKSYKPLNFNSEQFKDTTPLVAPFWADVDIENIKGQNATIVYRISHEPDILQKASYDVGLHFRESANFSAEVVIIVTWYNVGFYGASGVGRDKRNTFQVVLLTDQLQSYAIFNYNKTTWTTGSNSGGDTLNGTGTFPAVVGFYASKEKYYLFNDSQTNEIINITFKSNIGIAGKYMFRIDLEKVDDLQCFSRNISISPSSVSMLGQEIVKVAGPCLKPGQTVKARIRELNLEFPCDVDVDLTAICVIPSIFKTGDLTFDFTAYGDSWEYSTAISSVHLLNMPVKLTRNPPQLWQPGEIFTIQWNTSMAPSQLYKVLQLLAYVEDDDGRPDFTLLQQLSVPVGDTSRKFRLLSGSDLQSNNTLVIRLCWTNGQLPNIYPICIWSDVFTFKWNSSKELSEAWCEKWLTRERTLKRIEINPPYCPCNLTIIENDISHFHVDPICDSSKTTDNTNCLYNPGVYKCFQRNIKSGDLTGETCCYNTIGDLMDIRDNPGAGTQERFHYRAQGNNIVPFFSYFQSELLPKLHCCLLSAKNCSEFIYFRNATTCQNYLPPSPAQAAGDPHLITLDGKNYSFNGVGDFYLVKDEPSSLAIQVRAERAVDRNGQPQNATVFNCIAMAMSGTSDIIEIRKTNNGPEVLHNSKIIANPSGASEFRNISLITNSDGSYHMVLIPFGVSVSVEVTSYLLNIIVLIGEDDLKGRIRGLLGNYNGNANDDFQTRNGTLLPPTSNMRDIHHKFGMSWQVPANESLFSDQNNQMSNLLAFEPIFMDELSAELPNDTDEVCKANIQCRFDYQVTKNKDLARDTASFSTKFVVLRENLEQTVIRCPYLDTPENGNKTQSGHSEGSVAKFTCDLGYKQIHGTLERFCLPNSTWSGSEVVCAAEIPLVYTGYGKLLIIAIVSAVCGMMLITGVCITVCCCRSRKCRNLTHKMDTQLDMPTTVISSPVFENQSFLQGLHDLMKDGRFHIPRPDFVDPSLFEEYFESKPVLHH